MTATEIRDALAAPFAAHELKWKPQVVKDGKALAVAYIDARCVEERLDQVVGIGNWQDTFTILDKGGVVCRLSLRIDGDWIGKEGAGSESKQPDAGDRLKASFSSAFKLAAVKWGIGRYLYALPKQWRAYDEQRKQFTETPTVGRTEGRTPAPAAKKPRTAPAGVTNGQAAYVPPADGGALLARLQQRVRAETAAGHARAAGLIAHLEAQGSKCGYGPIETWGELAIAWAAKETTAFLASANGKEGA